MQIKKNGKKTIKEELEELKTNNTWTLVDLPQNRKPISCKWAFSLKRNEFG